MSGSTADTPDEDPREEDGHRVPTEDDYLEQSSNTRWVQLQDADGEFQVREVPPLKLLREMRDFGADRLMTGDEDDAAVQELIQSGRFDDFLESMVLPNILRPSCYWGDTGSGDFDLAALTADDLMTVIVGLTGQDREALEDEMGDSFQE